MRSTRRRGYITQLVEALARPGDAATEAELEIELELELENQLGMEIDLALHELALAAGDPHVADRSSVGPR